MPTVTIDLTDDEAAEMRRWRMKCDRAHESPFADVRVSAKLADALPRTFAVGDRVRLAGDRHLSMGGTVRAEVDGVLWVWWDTGGRSDYLPAELAPLEQPEVQS